MMAIKKLIPNLFTAGNLVGGILAIIFTLNGNIFLAPFCIFASAIFDFLDGFVARLLKVQGELGKQLDSLADMVTFGVAPGIIIYQIALNNLRMKSLGEFNEINDSNMLSDFIYTIQEANNNNFGLFETHFHINDAVVGTEVLDQTGGGFLYSSLVPFIAFLIPIFALFRLAKFNLDTRQSDSFIGLPTPAMTIFVAALPLMIWTADSEWQNLALEYAVFNPWGLSIITILISVLMVVELPLFALKIKNFKWKGNEIRYIFLTISLILLITLLWWALPLIIILYVVLSLLVKPKKNEIQS